MGKENSPFKNQLREIRDKVPAKLQEFIPQDLGAAAAKAGKNNWEDKLNKLAEDETSGMGTAVEISKIKEALKNGENIYIYAEEQLEAAREAKSEEDIKFYKKILKIIEAKEKAERKDNDEDKRIEEGADILVNNIMNQSEEGVQGSSLDISDNKIKSNESRISFPEKGRVLAWDKFVPEEIKRLKEELDKSFKEGDIEKAAFFEKQLKIAEGVNKSILNKKERIEEKRAKKIEEKKEKGEKGKNIEKARVLVELYKERDKVGKKFSYAKKQLEKWTKQGGKSKEGAVKHYQEEFDRLKKIFEESKEKIENWKKENQPKIEVKKEEDVKVEQEVIKEEKKSEEVEMKEEIREEDLPEAEIVEYLPDLPKEDLLKEETPEEIAFRQAAEIDVLDIETMLSPEAEVKFAQEASKLKEEIDEMPLEKREEIRIGIGNFGFFVKEKISNFIADDICINLEKSVGGVNAHGLKGSIGRFFSAMGSSYRKDALIAKNHLGESEKKNKLIKKSVRGVQNIGYAFSDILKVGRTVADVLGWTVGSPLRYAMLASQFFARGAAAVKEARLMNEKITKDIEERRIGDINKAADEAWRIYESAKNKYYIETGKNSGSVPKEFLNKVYIEETPKEILERLKNAEPGAATSILGKILQKVLKKDVEFAIKHGKFNEASFAERLKEFDKIISKQGTVDALAMLAKYGETAGKAAVAGLQIETVALLFQRLPEVMHKISGFDGVKVSDISEKTSEILEQKQRMAMHEQVVLGAMQEKIMENSLNKLEEAGRLAGVVGGTAEIDRLATVKQGEGIWHAVYRQLENNPSKFGLKISPGDLNNPAKLKEILNHKTGQLLAEQGYMKTGGVETRISAAGTKVLLDENGKIKIEGSAYSFKTPLESEKVIGNFTDYNLAEQERTLNLYEADIDTMQANFSEAKVKGNESLANALEKEISRLQDIKTSLVKNSSLAINREKFENFLSVLGRETGLQYREYSEIKDMRVDQFLEKYSGKWALWGIQRHYANLAKAISGYKLSESDKQFFSVDQILKKQSFK